MTTGVRLLTALVATTLASVPVWSQSAQGSALAFDVASVKAVDRLMTLPGGRVFPGDRFEYTYTLRRIIQFAYGFERLNDRVRGTDPVLEQLFSIVARGPAGSFEERTSDGVHPVRHMLRRLLADRFDLTVRIDQEVQPVWILKRASPTRLGPKLRPLPSGCLNVAASAIETRPPDLPLCQLAMPEGTLSGAVSSIDDLARFLSTSLQDAVDETGLTGAYTVETTFDKGTLMRFPANLPARFAALTDVSRYASLPPFITAFKDDLGLIVERAQRPVPIVVITHVGPLKEN